MPKPASVDEQAQAGHVRCHQDQGILFLCAIDVVMWAKDEDYDKARLDWFDAKRAMERDGSQLSEKFLQFKSKATDGKMRETDFLNVNQFFALALALPGKKTQRFKDAAAYLMAREFERQMGAKRQMTGYMLHGKSEAWAQARVEAKESTKALRTTLQETHIAGKPDYQGVFSAQNAGVFEMSKARIAAELGLSSSKAHEWREHLGQYAQKAIAEANEIAQARMKRTGGALSEGEQIEIVLRASQMAGSKLRDYAAFVGVDFLSGDPLNAEGNRIEKPKQVALLSSRGN